MGTVSVIPYVDLVRQQAALAGELELAFRRVLAHGQFVNGPEVDELEQALMKRLGVAGVVAVNSGTDALALALRLRGIGPGDEVITAAHSFLATANAIATAGARPVFVEIDDETMCIDPDAVARAITPHSKAILPVHLNGYPCDVSPLLALAEDRGLAVIEDAAQAFGSSRHGRPAGTRGIGCFSLHPLKVLSALGDGGFIAVASAEDARFLRRYRNHGLVDRDHAEIIGVNSRLDTLQAAFVLTKLAHLDEALAARRAHAEAYRAALAGVVRLPPAGPGIELNHSAFVIRHPQRDRLREHLSRLGVDAKIHYPLAIHQQAPYRAAAPQLPVTERVISEILSLPISAELSPADRDRVIAAVLAAAGTSP
jgi:UDP-2-acetamido-2-deoxy-ribo-hexuluronate aminotransferase